MESIIVFIVMLALIILFSGMAYVILKRKAYHLISGFNTRPKEEQEELIKRGSPQAVGKLLRWVAIILTLGLVLYLLSVPYAFEGSMAGMMFILLGGMIYIQKYDLPEKRKRSYLLNSIISIVIFTSIAVLFVIGFSKNDLTINNGQIEISGMYGITWLLDTIEDVQLLKELPEVRRRTNGYSFADRLKGNFIVEPYGRGKLFINGKNSPYLYIKMNDSFVIINGDSKDVEEWYKLIMDSL